MHTVFAEITKPTLPLGDPSPTAGSTSEEQSRREKAAALNDRAVLSTVRNTERIVSGGPALPAASFDSAVAEYKAKAGPRA